MLLHAVVGGSALILILGLFWESIHSMMPYIRNILIGGLIVQILSLAAELITPHPTVDSHRTVKIITKGVFKSEFWGGVVLIGSLIPFFMLISSFAPMILAIAGLLSLVGIWFSVRIWVIAPQMIPLS